MDLGKLVVLTLIAAADSQKFPDDSSNVVLFTRLKDFSRLSEVHNYPNRGLPATHVPQIACLL
jgi:hypothetical protein